MPRRGENIRKRKDNRWEGRYIKGREANGKAIYGSVYGKTYSGVKQKLKEYSNNNEPLDFLIKGSEMTFKEALFLWLENNKAKQKVQTHCKYLQIIESQILPQIGHIKLTALDTNIINEFINEKIECGRLDSSGGLSSSYIQTICFIIESTINFCVENKFCAPLSGHITRPVKNKKNLRILSFEEQKTLEKELFHNINERKLGMILSLYAGLRVGEVCGLKWKNIDLNEDIIHVCNTVERIKNIEKKYGSNKTSLILCDTKSLTSNREIPISPALHNILEVNSKKDTDLFVVKGSAHPFADPRTLQYAFKKCLKKCNLPDINFHALRHTFATRCIEAGVDVKC